MNPRNRHNNDRKLPAYVSSTFLLLCMIFIGGIFVMRLMQINILESIGIKQTPHKGSSPIQSGEDFNILIAGLDNMPGNMPGARRADAIAVAHFSQKNNYVNFVFIPRSTRVKIPGGYGMQRINSAYALGGSTLLQSTVEGFLGIKINYHYMLDLRGFVTIVDAFGGLDVYVEKNMKYTDRSQNLSIDLKKGQQHLDGEGAMEYALFRHDAASDLGRIQRQQNLIRSFNYKMAEELRSGNIVKDVARILKAIENNKGSEIIETDLSKDDILRLAAFYNSSLWRNTNSYTMPGTNQLINGADYLVPDAGEMPYLIGGALKGGYHPDNREVKIEVLNGCRTSNNAGAYSDRLKYYGFDIINEGTADKLDYKNTILLVQHKTSFDKAVARLLDAKIVNKPDSHAAADMMVILGCNK
jgi:polyisoprenyl-teichoic acid--peptidoglycan teichoic acid transferase